MNVLLLAHHFYPTIGGIESYALGLAKSLRENNIDCGVACLNRDPVTRQRLAAEEVIAGIQVRRVPFWDFGFYKIAFGLLKEIKKADIVHVQNIGFLSDFALLSRFLHKKPVIISTHGGISHTKERPALKGFYSKWLGFLLKKADFVIADSRQDFADFEKMAKSIRMVENGVEIEDFLSLERKPKSGSFVFVGRLAKNKRIDLLLEAFALVLQKKPDAMLRIVGSDFDNILYELQQKSIDLEISNRVFFSQNISAAQLLEIISESEFFVSASETEGFGISAVEAMAAGCIPILNDIDAFKAFVNDGRNGFLADFTNPNSAAEKIVSAMNLKGEEKARISENARSSVKKYSWKKVAAQIILIYEEKI